MSSLAGATSTQLKYVEIGTMIAMVLFGMPTAQVYIYFRRCDRDPRWMKFFVFGIWCNLSSHRGGYDDNNGHWVLRLLEFVYTFLSGYTVYSSTILNHNSSPAAVDIERVNELSGLIAMTISSSVIDTILLWSLEANVLTCLLSSLTFLFYQLSRGVFANWIWVPLALITCQSYSMCIFACFIGRYSLGGQRTHNALGLATRNTSGLQDIPTVASRVE
ncbi:hypothetical protein P691DRAFT_775305 [Macrolepiota fuliginosa MF-IS2]|uniref:Uncharacterized protein n=1 Tax=Macrolepiota fuliginosa MF-IS2 TaxID=1400762 RepID=A0A9P5XEB6_9AGAR|nr:hypothetical protein P691DRAFT_775305 [Macrolepiota fuliginosa MF-IS2]